MNEKKKVVLYAVELKSYKTNSRCLLLQKYRKLKEQRLELVICYTEVPEISVLFHL